MTLTEKILRNESGVVHNPYQGKDKKVLFVCSAGILRSATAARIYGRKYNTRCAGTGLDYALIPPHRAIDGLGRQDCVCNTVELRASWLPF